MKLVMIGAGIIAMTGMSAAIANPQFNQPTHSHAAIQLVAEEGSSVDASKPALQQNDTAQSVDHGQAPANQNTPTQPMSNTDAATTDQPASNPPSQNDQNSQNSY